MPTMTMQLRGMSLIDACLAFEAVSNVKILSATVIDDTMATIYYVAIEPEPEYICNDDCWLYGRKDEGDGFFPCSHCYKITRE